MAGTSSHSCAQRLSASLRTTQLELGPGLHHGRQCSTPFGITADNTRLPPGQGPGRVAVLNAFRHHCGQHLCNQDVEPQLLQSAQRLSASLRTTRPNRTSGRVVSRSAQRLSASLRTTRFPRAWASRVNPAAGAQRLSASLRTTLRRGQRGGVRHGVLNAFRHHCGQHWLDTESDHHGWMCSTPFGITADNTDSAGADGRYDYSCSTPFGITADNTGQAPAAPRVSSRAQRLSASLRTTRVSG